MRSLAGLSTNCFVVALTSFIAFYPQVALIWPWYGRIVSVDLLKLLVPFNFLIAMLLWNYFLCIVTNPGEVPKSWRPTSLEGVEVKELTGKPRFCRTCNNYKPARSHHCRQCNRCVLKMDHHCPWIDNCVGFHNQGHFIRFLFYVDISCTYHLAMVGKMLYDTVWVNPEVDVFLLLNIIASAFVLLLVGGFSIFHFLSLTANSTTIEDCEKEKTVCVMKHGKVQKIKFPYNLGTRRNIESVLGEYPWLWCCPTVPPGDGLSFETGDSEEHQEDIFESDDDGEGFRLPSSPWTYKNESLNPALKVGRQRKSRSHRCHKSSMSNHSVIPNYPPYHHEYSEVSEAERSSDDVYGLSADASLSSDEEASSQSSLRRHTRMGSEGVEVKAIDRDKQLYRILEDSGEEFRKQLRYLRAQDKLLEDEDDVPLAPPLDEGSQERLLEGDDHVTLALTPDNERPLDVKDYDIPLAQSLPRDQ